MGIGIRSGYILSTAYPPLGDMSRDLLDTWRRTRKGMRSGSPGLREPPETPFSVTSHAHDLACKRDMGVPVDEGAALTIRRSRSQKPERKAIGWHRRQSVKGSAQPGSSIARLLAWASHALASWQKTLRAAALVSAVLGVLIVGVVLFGIRISFGPVALEHSGPRTTCVAPREISRTKPGEVAPTLVHGYPVTTARTTS